MTAHFLSFFCVAAGMINLLKLKSALGDMTDISYLINVCRKSNNSLGLNHVNMGAVVRISDKKLCIVHF